MEQQFDFRSWIAHQSGNYEYKKVDDDHILLVTPYTEAQINFYDIGEGQDEVVEFKIIEGNEYEPKFFLHFQPTHKEHAIELFYEFVDALEEFGNKQTKEILLCCTSAFTTSYFAECLNKEAQANDLNYSFNAVSVDHVYEAGVGKYAILLAPQIAYMQKELAPIMKDSIVLTIPGKLFGSFDARSYLPELERELNENRKKKQQNERKEIKEFSSNDKRTLVISIFGSSEEARIYYRLYDHWDVVVDDVVIKKRITGYDIEDVINLNAFSADGKITVDQIGIAIPGIIDNGILDLHSNQTFDLNYGLANGFNLKEYYENLYKVPVYVNNNTNAAALGWYAKHKDEYEGKNIIYYSQPRGYIMGGQGIVINGQLVPGKNNAAGEIKYILNRFSYTNPLSFNPFNPEDMLQVVTNTVLMDIALLNVDVVCVRCPLMDDMVKLKENLKKYVPESILPELRYVENYNEHIMIGELAICLGGSQDESKSIAS